MAKHDTPSRSFLKSFFLQIVIRIKYFILSWGFLKPLVIKNLSDCPTKGTYKHTYISSYNVFRIKFLTFIAGFIRQFNWSLKLSYGTRFMHVLHFGYKSVERSILKDLKARNIAATRGVSLPTFDWKSKSPDDFYNEYVKHPHPVLLKGFLKEFIDLDQWSFDALVKKYGGEEVLLTNPEKDGYLGALREIDNPDIYLHNSEILFKRHPDLLSALSMDRLESYSHMKPAWHQFFIGRKKTGAPMHCAANWNFLYMLDGKKKWYLIHPNDSYFVYPLCFWGRHAAIGHCLYPDKFDKEVFPLAEYCPYFEVTLEPGDILFNPPWWWHSVENISEKTVSVATRWLTGGVAGKNYTMTEENYDINRLYSLFFQLGLPSVKMMHEVLQSVSPTHKNGKVTLREQRVRYISLQKQISSEPILGLRNKF